MTKEPTAADALHKPKPDTGFGVAIAIGTLVVAAIGVFAGFQAAQVTAESSREEAALERRVTAYAAYFEQQAMFNELVWEGYAWAGEDAPSDRPGDDSAYRSRAVDIVTSLESTFWRAEIVTPDDESIATLRNLNNQTHGTWLAFKCFSGLQEEFCPNPAVIETRDEMEAQLNSWSQLRYESQVLLGSEIRPDLD